MGTELSDEPKEPKEQKAPKELSFWVLLWIVLAVVALWVGTGFLLYDANDETPIWGNRGTFGDMFGSINALFSGLAFAGLIFTVLLQRQELQMQRHELRLQREEIVESRKELEGQRVQLEAQNQTFILQRFEGTFFQLFPNFIRIAESRASFKSETRYTNDVGQAVGNLENEIGQETAAHARYEDAVSAAYRTVLQRGNFLFLPRYFAALYSVLAFVDRSEVPNKQFYANLLRNELTGDEICLVAYVGLTDVAGAKLKPLIERYRLLKNISNQFLFDNLALLNAYDRSAFRTDLPAMLSTNSSGSQVAEWASSQHKT